MSKTKQTVKVPTQAQIDAGVPPRGWHYEFVTDGVALVRNGYRCDELPAGLLGVEGEYSWRSFYRLPTADERRADSAE